jgi:hypothetical protein
VDRIAPPNRGLAARRGWKWVARGRRRRGEKKGKGRGAGAITNHGGDGETAAGEGRRAAALTGGRRVGGSRSDAAEKKQIARRLTEAKGGGRWWAPLFSL